MKKVFNITTRKKVESLISGSLTYTVFAEKMSEAISKVDKVIEEDHQIVEAELLCTVEEDKDLEEYKEE